MLTVGGRSRSSSLAEIAGPLAENNLQTKNGETCPYFPYDPSAIKNKIDY